MAVQGANQTYVAGNEGISAKCIPNFSTLQGDSTDTSDDPAGAGPASSTGTTMIPIMYFDSIPYRLNTRHSYRSGRAGTTSLPPASNTFRFPPGLSIPIVQTTCRT